MWGAAGMKGQEVDQRGKGRGQGGELIGHFGRVIPPADQHVLERHSPAKLLQCVKYLGEAILFFDGHQFEP